MNPRLPTFAAALCAVWCLPALAQDASKTPTFTADVQMVHLLVTVRTPEGRPTGDVARNEFRIFDNGVPQDLAVFDERSGQPLSVALLIDTSLSTKIKLKSEKDSVRAYLQALFSGGNPGDALSLFNFDWRVTQATGFTRNLKWLDDRLTAMISEGGTSLYDAIYLASKELDRRTGRHVMLVISDGGDTVSTKDFHAALRALHDADTVLYAILVVPVEADAGRNVGGENALYGLSTGTGGSRSPPALVRRWTAPSPPFFRICARSITWVITPRALRPPASSSTNCAWKSPAPATPSRAAPDITPRRRRSRICSPTRVRSGNSRPAFFDASANCGALPKAND